MALAAAFIGPALAARAGASPTASPSANALPAAGAEARVVTMTYLKSQPRRLSQLERFIRANWFAMDEIAVQQGLFVSYEWLDTGSDDGPWNAIVMVTYADEKGFDGIQQRWAGIKAAHREVRPDGLALSDLGRVLETKNLYERAPFATRQAARPR